MITEWIAHRLEQGERMQKVMPDGQDLVPEELVFYTDARASETDAEIGGYLAVDQDLKKCPWFNYKVDTSLAPWLFCRAGNPKRVIAALELLGTIIALNEGLHG